MQRALAHIARTTVRGRRPLAELVVVAGLVLCVPAAAAALPPPVVGPPSPPPIVPYVSVNPSEGPVGTLTTWKGICGFPAKHISWGLNLDDPNVGTVELGGVFTPIQPSPLGVFTVHMQIPATGNVPSGPGANWDFTTHPGTYAARVICDLDEASEGTVLETTFQVTLCNGHRNCTEA